MFAGDLPHVAERTIEPRPRVSPKRRLTSGSTGANCGRIPGLRSASSRHTPDEVVSTDSSRSRLTSAGRLVRRVHANRGKRGSSPRDERALNLGSTRFLHDRSLNVHRVGILPVVLNAGPRTTRCDSLHETHGDSVSNVSGPNCQGPPRSAQRLMCSSRLHRKRRDNRRAPLRPCCAAMRPGRSSDFLRERAGTGWA